jgi:hypothetical protein
MLPNAAALVGASGVHVPGAADQHLPWPLTLPWHVLPPFPSAPAPVQPASSLTILSHESDFSCMRVNG